MPMNRIPPALAALLAIPSLAACSTAATIVTAPVRIASKGVDWATTSQSESDEKRGRALRKREAELGKLDRDYKRHNAQCDHGDENACERARDEYEEIQDLSATIPADRR